MNMVSRIRVGTLLGALFLAVSATQAQQSCPAGYPQTTPDADFADAGNGTVLRLPSGLVWKRCAEGQTWTGATCTGTADSYTWAQAFSRVDAVNAGAAGTQNGGQTDWRLPNINELRSVVEQGCTNPCINLSQFPLAPASFFWSGSPATSVSGDAWGVYFDYGGGNLGGRQLANQVRLVRAGRYFYNFDAAAATPAAIQPQDGLWAIDTEVNGQNGRGFQIETHNGTLVFTYYGYRTGGHDHWYLAAGSLANGSFSDSMTQYEGGTALGAAYTPAVANGTAGTIAMTFTGATSGSITLPGESTKSISKFAFSGGGSPTMVPDNGLWVIDAELNGQDGRGFQIEQHGSLLVFTYYGYDAGGQETWYLAAGSMIGDSFTSGFTEYGGGTILGGTYSAATETGSPGPVTITFTSATTGIITLPGESPRAISKFSW
jgi:hypothetical protein